MMLCGMTGISSTHLARVRGDDMNLNPLPGPVWGIGTLRTFVKWTIIGA